MAMDRLRRSFRSLRGRSSSNSKHDRPHQWQQDEASVRAGTCNFLVKYLGCVEVFESRGMQVCEEALKLLRNQRKHSIKGILYVSGDGLRVVDNEHKGLIVDQTIEKVSFCAPDRHHERGFAYICRDGTTRRWMCHGFHAVKESGERLSHAVGCAFAVCLEKKQKRDREMAAQQSTQQSIPAPVQEPPSQQQVSASSQPQNFRRQGSFKQASLTERRQDPQNVKPAEAPPLKAPENPHAVARPHANPELFERQGSIRLNSGSQPAASPFKRNYSLRLNELPSNLARHNVSGLNMSGGGVIAGSFTDSPPSMHEDNNSQQRRQPISSTWSTTFTPALSTIAASNASLAGNTSAQLSSAAMTSPHNESSSVQWNGHGADPHVSRAELWLQSAAQQARGGSGSGGQKSSLSSLNASESPLTLHSSSNASPGLSYSDRSTPPVIPPRNFAATAVQAQAQAPPVVVGKQYRSHSLADGSANSATAARYMSSNVPFSRSVLPSTAQHSNADPFEQAWQTLKPNNPFENESSGVNI